MLEEILEVMDKFFILSVMISQVHSYNQMFSFIHYKYVHFNVNYNLIKLLHK